MRPSLAAGVHTQPSEHTRLGHDPVRPVRADERGGRSARRAQRVHSGNGGPLPHPGRLPHVLVVRGTRKFLARAGAPTATPDDRSTTTLGDWYATVLFWRPQVALFVNETTRLPLIVLLAPSATVVDRLLAEVEAAFRDHGLDATFVAAELAQMSEHRLAATASRSVVGSMNDFTHLAEAHRDSGTTDLRELSRALATTPCGPLYGSHVSPDRELAARAAAHRRA